MHRAGLAGFAGVVVLGLAGLFVAAAADEEQLAFTLGVKPMQIAAVAKPRQQACQTPIDVPARASKVQFRLGTYGQAGPQLAVTAVSDGQTLGAGRVSPGYADNSTVTAALGAVPAGRRIRLCIRNEGSHPVALYGGAAQAARTSAAQVDGKELATDITLVFERSHPRSMLSALPDMFRRAALWHPGWVGEWTFWLLLGLAISAVPLLLGWALARSEEVPGGSYDSRP
jgi:hypothetical protein